MKYTLLFTIFTLLFIVSTSSVTSDNELIIKVDPEFRKSLLIGFAEPLRKTTYLFYNDNFGKKDIEYRLKHAIKTNELQLKDIMILWGIILIITIHIVGIFCICFT